MLCASGSDFPHGDPKAHQPPGCCYRPRTEHPSAMPKDPCRIIAKEPPVAFNLDSGNCTGDLTILGEVN